MIVGGNSGFGGSSRGGTPSDSYAPPAAGAPGGDGYASGGPGGSGGSGSEGYGSGGPGGEESNVRIPRLIFSYITNLGAIGQS